MLAAAALGVFGLLAAQSPIEADVAFALDELERKCGHFFELKEIDWKAVRKEIGAAAKKAATDEDELVVLSRLLARLRDGHARVEKGPQGSDLAWPDDAPFGGRRGDSGMAWCRIGGKIFVKSAAGPAADAGVAPGSEVLKVEGRRSQNGSWRARPRGATCSLFRPRSTHFSGPRTLASPVPRAGAWNWKCASPTARRRKRT